MRYNLYIYKSMAITAAAFSIHSCNRAVSLNSLREWDGNQVAHYMEYFDVRGIAAKIHALVGEKCCVQIRKPPSAYGDVEYLCVATSYAHAAAVLPYIHCITQEHELVLYDAETKRTFFRDLVNKPFIQVKSRIADYIQAVREAVKPVWRIRKIGVSRTEQSQDYAYVVTLQKDPKKSFVRRCGDFYRCLCDQLLEDEEINTNNACFTIVGKQYTISFCLEGYKKHPDQMGCYQQGRPSVKLIRRMGCEEGFFWLKQNQIEVTAILERMNFKELRQAYPNPADRFVAGINIQKWESRRELYVRYCGIGPYGSEILFHIVPSDFYKDENEISVLAVEEDSAGPILSAVGRFYQYFWDRYYLEENHVPVEMWVDIVEEARRIKEEAIRHRSFHDAKILDVFIRWSEAQLRLCDNGRMFNIQGP